ncbi:hypothetical protein CAPTEDRAFT_143227, partial [Capitella teleta]
CKDCGASSSWASQPLSGRTAAGNILLSASILFAKIFRVLRHLGVQCPNNRIYRRHQKDVLLPAINKAWSFQQAAMFGDIRASGSDLVLGEDGREDKPRHSAKYGSYSLMEKEGLQRSIARLEAEDTKVDLIVTDRHMKDQKEFLMLRFQMHLLHPNGEELFSFIGVSKKLDAIGKLKTCQEINLWTNSVVDHLYWSVSSTQDSNGHLTLAKWLSVLNHVMNEHEGHGNLFPRCLHESITGIETRKTWIKP